MSARVSQADELFGGSESYQCQKVRRMFGLYAPTQQTQRKVDDNSSLTYQLPSTGPGSFLCPRIFCSAVGWKVRTPSQFQPCLMGHDNSRFFSLTCKQSKDRKPPTLKKLSRWGTTEAGPKNPKEKPGLWGFSKGAKPNQQAAGVSLCLQGCILLRCPHHK